MFGLLTSVDDTFSFILNFIPGFYALRFIVYVWMFYPRANNGSVVIYSYIKPYLQQWKVPIKQLSKNYKEKQHDKHLQYHYHFFIHSYLLTRTIHLFFSLRPVSRKQFLLDGIATSTVCISVLVTLSQNVEPLSRFTCLRLASLFFNHPWRHL